MPRSRQRRTRLPDRRRASEKQALGMPAEGRAVLAAAGAGA